MILNIPTYLKTDQVAAILGVSVRTLENWRSTGGGPRFMRVGKRAVRYRPEDVQAFVEGMTFANTGEAQAAAA
ncbi:helix-turn-helix transcriptional regulator [Oceanibaculum indicum]|uniref:Helix-turn-helix domain-containing protein n=1 Tax=Oceanibaculum indicum P24 TaxID=1207063 RepID=K2K913_9PROT|nr:helix-turn-helix domain-containing protein [Oceanibaculum indicum]EKE73775.1 hypothetical protein P24_12452 [Oceanibaculum indicum P24]